MLTRFAIQQMVKQQLSYRLSYKIIGTIIFYFRCGKKPLPKNAYELSIQMFKNEQKNPPPLDDPTFIGDPKDPPIRRHTKYPQTFTRGRIYDRTTLRLP